MGKKTTRNLDKKRIFAFLALGLVGLGIVSLYVVNQLDIARDQQRFEYARKKNDAIAARLAVALGQEARSQTESNTCFNSEQGPFNDGRLWCQVATITKLTRDVSFGELSNQMRQVAQREKIETNTSGEGKFASLWYKLPGDFTCSMLVMDQEGGEVGSVTYDPLVDTRGASVALACADRARAKYYPFVQ